MPGMLSEDETIPLTRIMVWPLLFDLIANGCGHIHVYTMNKPEVAAGILNNLKGII